MIEIVKAQTGNRTKECYQYRLFAFQTQKGIFTLSGTNSDGTDEWRQLGTCNFYTWERSHVYQWFKSGKISPVENSKTLDWHLNTINKKQLLRTA